VRADQKNEKIAKDFLQGNWKDTLIVTRENTTKNELNRKIREELQARGEIGKQEIHVKTLESKKPQPN